MFVKNKRTPLYPGVELLNGVLINERDNVSGWTRGDAYSKQESALIMSHQRQQCCAPLLAASLLSPRRLFAPRVLLVTPPQGLFWFSAVSLLEFVFSGRAAPRRALQPLDDTCYLARFSVRPPPVITNYYPDSNRDKAFWVEFSYCRCVSVGYARVLGISSVKPIAGVNTDSYNFAE